MESVRQTGGGSGIYNPPKLEYLAESAGVDASDFGKPMTLLGVAGLMGSMS